MGEKTVTAMYTSKDDLTPLLYSGKIIKKKKKKMCYIYTMEYYSAIKKNDNAICSNMDGARDSHTE